MSFSDKRWKETKSLHSIMTIPDKFKPYVQDYQVKVYDIAFLEDYIIERFTSDFRLVAKFFKNKRQGRTDLFGEEKINHIEAFMDFLAVFTDDKHYKQIKKELVIIERERGEVRMCSIAQALEEKGIEKGMEKGRILQLVDLIDSGDISLERAAEKAGMTIEVFKEKVKSLK